MDHNKLLKILKEAGIPDHLTSLLRNLYADQETTVITRQGTMDKFQIGKDIRQSCILSPCLLNLYAQYITWNARLDEAQAGIKIARRNISKMTPPLWQKGKRNSKASWWKWKRTVKSWLKAQHSENEDHGIRSHHFMANRWGNTGDSDRLYFFELLNHFRWWLQPWN